MVAEKHRDKMLFVLFTLHHTIIFEVVLDGPRQVFRRPYKRC